MNNDIENELEAKVVVIREGAALRTSDELMEQFIEDACGFLDVNPQVDEYDEDDRSNALSQAVSVFESKLSAAGYTTVWDDGYVIYKDLSDEAKEYLSEVYS